MRTTKRKGLSARDRQTIDRIARPAEQVAKLLREYVASDDFVQLVSKLVRAELARQHKEVCHGSH